MRSQNQANPNGLRDFLSAEYGRDMQGVPLSSLIRECYREFLLQAHADPAYRLPHSLVQQRLRQIAHDFLGDRDRTCERPLS
jgi:hypothetical protein